MKTVLKFLIDCKTFYLATVEGDQPRVRPFGAVCEFDGKLYFITSNQKPVYKQMAQNPKVEISSTLGDEWLRLTGKAVFDARTETKLAMLEANPMLKEMYDANDQIMEVFYLKDAVANILSFTGKNEKIEF